MKLPITGRGPLRSRGLGDTIAKFTHATGLRYIATAYTTITGLPCHCDERQEKLNQMFPYEQSRTNVQSPS